MCATKLFLQPEDVTLLGEELLGIVVQMDVVSILFQQELPCLAVPSYWTPRHVLLVHELLAATKLLLVMRAASTASDR